MTAIGLNPLADDRDESLQVYDNAAGTQAHVLERAASSRRAFSRRSNRSNIASIVGPKGASRLDCASPIVRASNRRRAASFRSRNDRRRGKGTRRDSTTKSGTETRHSGSSNPDREIATFFSTFALGVEG